jgi:hypothetical protein
MEMVSKEYSLILENVSDTHMGGLEKAIRVLASEFERMGHKLDSDENGIEGIFLRYLRKSDESRKK